MDKQQTDTIKTNFLIRFLLDTRYRWCRHLVLFVSFFVMATNVVLLDFLEYRSLFDSYACCYIVLLAALYLGSVYLNIYVLIPHFLLRRRFGMYCFWLLLTVAVLLFIAFWGEYLLYMHYRVPPGEYSYFYQERIVGLEILANYILYIMCNIGAAATVLFRYWMNYEKQVGELERDNLRSELEQLKKQVNPEFLLDTLAKAGKAADREPAYSSVLLVGLSRLLRYQLYDTNRAYVLLAADIAYIRSFLDFKKLLYPDFEYSVSVEGNTGRFFLPPLLFIPFVEYFAARVSGTGIGQFIRLACKVEGNKLDFFCSGSAVSVLPEDEDGVSDDLRKIVMRLKSLYGTTFRIERSQRDVDELYLSILL